jgi:DNA primase
MIEEKVKDEILDYGGRNIASIIGGYIELHKEGNVYKACCPFHGEKTPSFTVDPARQSWRCFGSCAEGGNVATFIMKIENIRFPAAMQKLAEMGCISMGEDSKVDKERKAMLLVLSKANSFYQNTLQTTSDALAYVGKRMPQEMVKEHGIGFAPTNGGKALVSYLTKEKLPLWAAEMAGLIRKDETTGEYKDRYWGRMTFPIKNSSGYIIGFGGRAITDQAKVKYINSHETPLYKKSEVLFGLDKALEAIKQSGEAIVVEGYMDWIAAWNAGVKNVVASCGTAFTKEHAAVLKRYAVRKIHFMFDGDDAGKNALKKAIQIAIDADMAATAFILPDEVDPDDYFKAGGKLEDIKSQSGLSYLESTGTEMSVTYQKLLRLERLESGMLWLAKTNPDVAAVLVKRGRWHELFDTDSVAQLSAKLLSI